MRITFIVPYATALVMDSNRPFGGIETRSWTLAQELAKDTELHISYVVSHHVKQSFILNNVRIETYQPVHPALESEICADTDLICTFGVNIPSAEAIYYAHRKSIPSILFLASYTDLQETYRYGSDYINFYNISGHLCSYSLSYASKIIVQTTDQQETLKQFFQRDSFLLRNPAPDWPLEKTSTKPYVLWIGRTGDLPKRPQLLVEIAKQLPSLQFKMIVNEFKDSLGFQELKKLAPSNVEIIEPVAFSEIPQYFSNCFAFVNTSAKDNEGFPNTLLQAAASNKPVISLSIDPDKLFTEQACGVFCDNSISHAVTAIQEAHEGGLAEFQENFKAKIEAQHKLEDLSQNLINEFKSIQYLPSLEALSFDFFDTPKIKILKAFLQEKILRYQSKGKIAFFPYGRHSFSLVKLLGQDFINWHFIDDNKSLKAKNIKLSSTEHFQDATIDYVFLSSDAPSPNMKKKAEELFGNKLIEIYPSFLGSGPFLNL